jgi:ankyrin repeat protein
MMLQMCDRMIATSTRHVAIVGRLLAAGASVHKEDKMGRTALFGAAFSGHVGLTRLLVKEHDADVRHADNRGVTPLFVAVLGIKVQGDHDDVIELLVASGAAVDRRGLEGRTPLYLAAEGGRLGAVDCMLRMTEHLAAETQVEIHMLNDRQMRYAEGLAGRGELAATDPEEERVLRQRLRDSRQEEADLQVVLQRHRNAVNVANEQGRSPLWVAVANRRVSVVERLIAGNADINLADARGFTPLIQSAVKDLSDMVACLLRAKADIGQQAREGPTALGWARGCGSRSSAMLLLEAGARWESDWGPPPKLPGEEDIAWDKVAAQALADAQAEEARQKAATTGTITWAQLIA